MSAYPKDERCAHCKREIKPHSLGWIMPNLYGGGERPKEEETDEVTWEFRRHWSFHVEPHGDGRSWVGMRVRETICERCWTAGKRFEKAP